MLEFNNVSYIKNGKEIIKNISFKFDKNKFIVITGPNGSGKSTLAKLIMGIIRPTSGTILFNNEDITNLSIDERARKGISFSFQQPVKFKGITVYDLIKLSTKEEITEKKACEILSKVGLCAKDYINREINSSLSGGELKRIELASIILRDSMLNIFDEPEAGIDLWSFNNLIKLFKDMRTEHNLTIVISHQERIINIADEILLMENGTINKVDSKDELYKNIESISHCKKGSE